MANGQIRLLDMEGDRELRRLLEGARATRYINYGWASEVCDYLRKLADGRAEEEVRARVQEVLQKVTEEFDRNVERWVARGVRDNELWPLYERLVEAAELLAVRPDKLAVISFCAKAKALTAAIETVNKVALLK